MTDLAPGSYRIQFFVNQYWNGSGYERPNLVNEYYNDAADYASAEMLDLSESSASNIDAQLSVGRTISGRVTLPDDVDRAAMSAISVSASNMNGGSGYAPVDPITGEYSITGLAPGDYRVQFNVGQYWNGTTSVRPNLMSEYYDNVTGWDAATTVNVSDGDKSGIDAALESGRSISGTVTLPSGAPTGWLSSISVSAAAANGSIVGSYSAPVDPNTGDYTITGLAPGSYQVAFRVMNSMPGTEVPNLVDEYYDNAYTLSTATPVDVTSDDRTGINAALEEGTSISGTITLPADAPTEWMQAVGVSAIGPDGTSLGNTWTRVDPATGDYTIDRLPRGEHRVAFTPSGGNLLSPEYYDDATTLDHAKSVSTVDGDAAGIDAELELGARINGAIDVRALRAAAGPEVGYSVYLTDETGMTEVSGYGDPLFQDEIGMNIGVVRPGTYRIAIVTSTWDATTNTSTPQSAQFLRFGHAGSITLEAGDEITDLHLTARATDATLSGTLTTEGFDPDPIDGILGSTLFYERFDGDWARLPGTRFDTDRNGTTPFTLAVPSGTYTVGYENDYSTAGIDTTEQWWNNKTSLATATPVPLAGGAHTTGIDGTIRPAGEEPPSDPEPVTRQAGGTRFETSIAISQATFKPNVPVVYIANAYNFPDALSGSTAAAINGGPVLLTPADSIPDTVKAELRRLKPARIVILGGPISINHTVSTQLEAFTTGKVTRQSGGTRFDTSIAISQATFEPNVPVVYIANAYNFPDALSGSTAAAINGGPVLLTPADSIPDTVKAELRRLKPARIVILGGPISINHTVSTQLEEFVANG